MNPLDWDGPTFLVFYLLLLLITATCAAVYRQLYLEVKDHGELPQLTPYEIAFLQNGANAVGQAAIVKLMHAGCLRAERYKQTLIRVGDAPTSFDDVERAVYESSASEAEASHGAQFRDQMEITRRYVKLSCAALQTRLEGLNLILTESQAQTLTLVTSGIIACPLLLSVPKIAVGISRGRPVAFLIFLVLLNIACVLFAAFRHTLIRTSFGTDAVEHLKYSLSTLQYACKRQASLPPDDLAMAFALYGASAVLAYPTLVGMQRLLSRPVTSSNYGSSCSGSAGCGGGCGGDGCGGGGGGCGGCGGCGG